MLYSDLDTDKAKKYVVECAGIFAKDAVLDARELGRNDVDGDGYVNHIYRVWDGNGNSVIIKQAKPYLKIFGEGVFPMPVDRNGDEIDIMRIRAAITPQYVPKLLHADRENHLYVCEDCGRLGIMRFGLSQGRRYPNFPRMMGEFLAKNNFYTSEIHIDQRVHKELSRKFTSAKMSLIMETVLFLKKSILDDISFEQTPPEPLHKAVSDQFWDHRDVRIELMKLRDIYMKKQECLVHGDIHTSNTLIDDDEMKIIDMEYTHMGPFSSDSGYLLGNLVYTYITWFYHDEWTSIERALYREEVLGYIEDTLYWYIRTFTECWTHDAKGIFREYPEYLETLFSVYLKETCGFMGSQICSRVGGFVETYDFDVIKDGEKRAVARAIAMSVAYALIMKRNEINALRDITNLIKCTVAEFRKKIGEE
jgi:5-methylthioribose kinase